MKYLVILALLMTGCVTKQITQRPLYMEQLPTEPIYEPMVRLYKKGQFRCTAFIIDANYALTAAHCADVGEKDMELTDVNDIKTNTKVECLESDHNRDVALLKGNFNKFAFIPVDFTGENQANMTQKIFYSCGFPEGGSPFCSISQFTGPYYFMVSSRGGLLYQGMSGGPVIDVEQRRVMGINSGISESTLLFGSLIGMDAQFKIKRKTDDHVQ
jgi:hypothetical protein